MTNRRDPERRATRQAAAQRVALRKARELVSSWRELALELRRALIELYAGQFLVDVDPFWRDVREDDVVDERGRIDYRAVDVRVRDLLARKPYLARHDTP